MVSASREGKGGKQLTFIPPKPVLAALDAYLQGLDGGTSSRAEIKGPISTKQIQRLLDEAAKEVGLPEDKDGQSEAAKENNAASRRRSFSRWSLDTGIDIIYCNSSWDILR